MQKILLLLSLFPFISSAQIKSSSIKDTPLIESITSDTLHGTCKAIVFEYDQLKRVSSISVKKIDIKKGSKTGTESVETLIKVQKFQYHQNEQIPFASHTFNYDYEDIRIIRERVGPSQQLQYFLFKNDKRIGDSAIYQEYEQLVKDATFDNKNKQKRVASFVQTPTKVIHVLDLTERDPDTYHPNNIYIDSFAINKKHNLNFESSEHDIGHHGFPRVYITFTEFDQAINPLHQLNIAPLLSNEKITISYNNDDLLQIEPSFDHNNGTEVNWHYLNQNNPLIYAIERGETETPFKDIIQFSYTYNQYHQPTYCKTNIKKVMNKYPERRYGIAGTFKKSFTFKYKKD